MPGDGTYTLVVRGSINVTTEESYEFQVVAPETLTTRMTLGESVSTAISQAGEQDIYNFSGTTGQRLFFDQLTGSDQITAQLYSPSGALVFNGKTNDSDAPFFLRETGDYRLVIDGNNDTTGDYGFRLVDLETVSTLKLDTVVETTLDPGTGTDFFQFNAPTGQPLYFDLTADSWTGANWVLYGPDNQAIATPDGRYPDFKITPTKAGTYILAVSGYSETPLDYSFKVSTPTTTTTPLLLGSTVVQTLSEAGEQDEYAFTGTVGQRLFYGPSWGVTASVLNCIAPQELFMI